MDDSTSPIEADQAPAPIEYTKEKNTELKLNPSKIFSGKREDFDGFLQDVILYLNINKQIYDDDKRVSFVLSFMNEGDAKSWKAQYV